MKRRASLTVIGFVFITFLFFPLFFVHADEIATSTETIAIATTTPIHLTIQAASSTLFDADMQVSSCQATSTSQVSSNGFCAIEQTNLPVTWVWYSFGPFLNSVGNYAGDMNNYWLWSADGNDGMTSLDAHILSPNEHLLLSFYMTPVEATTTDATSTPQDPVTATSTDQVSSGNGGGGSGGAVQNTTPLFNVPKAVAFLSSNQNGNGSFNADLYTDWAAIAFASYGSQNSAIYNFLSSEPFVGSSITDYERHAMALMSLGINPYSGTPVNFIKKITDSFDGTQIGDQSLYNDDIFSLFPLLKAGYTASDPIILKTVQFILSKQAANGSWDSVDLTSAAIQALSQVQSINGVPNAINNAENYLRNSEQANGGFGSSYSTSWALQAMSTLGQSSLLYLAGLQQTDGGVESTSTTSLDGRIWATAYAIPAALGRSWPSILNSFSKPLGADTDVSNNLGITATSTSATTTNITHVRKLTTPLKVRGVADLTVQKVVQDKTSHSSTSEQIIPAQSTSTPSIATSSTSLAAVYASANGSKNWIFVVIAFILGLGAISFGIYKMKS